MNAMPSMLKSLRNKLSVTNWSLVWFFVAVIIFFSMVSPTFRSSANLRNILANYSHIGIVAVGMTFPLLLGGIDLSVGSMMSLAAMVMFDATLLLHLPGWVAILAGLITGVLAGLVNALLIVRVKLQPFVATLATLVAYRGLTYLISGRQINPDLTVVAIRDKLILSLDGKVGQIPLAFIYLLVLVVLTMIFLRFTRLGIDLYAVGGNPMAARLAGINVDRVKILGYVLSGFFTAIAALVLTSRMGTTQEGLGQGLELSAIAAAVIGGVSLNGGIGNTFGAALGNFLIGTLSTGLILIGVTGYAPMVVIGVVLLMAVGYDRFNEARRQRRWLDRQHHDPTRAKSEGTPRLAQGTKSMNAVVPASEKVIADHRPVLLKARGLSKRYGAVQALENADMDLWAGQVHALVGSNGAGKSTLVKILTGAVVPDSGDLLVDGNPISGNTRDMLNAGIACIYQDSQLVPALSVLDNIMLGRQPVRRFGFLDRKTQRHMVTALLAKHDLRLDVDSPVMALSTVQQKEVEIAKALSLNARIILMDEPTAALSHAEVERLFESIRRLRSQGVAILYISHMLEEIFAIADQVTVIRDGKVRISVPISDIPKKTLIETMLGQELTAEARTAHKEKQAAAQVALECRGLSKAGLFDNISLIVHSGEIVCLTGLVGAKRSELVRALFGVDPADHGEIYVYGKPVRIKHPLDAIKLGMGFVPEDRRRDGLFMDLSVAVNIVMATLSNVTRMGLLSQARIRAVGQEQMSDLAIVPARLDAVPRALSGGNQQKVLLGRWLTGDTRIIILDEPTVGIDVGTKANIYALLRKLAAANKAILMVSSDIEEVLTIADRVIVMAQGRITGNFEHAEISQERILRAVSGEGF